MKYIKAYEATNFKEGEFIYCIDDLASHENILRKHKKYKVIKNRGLTLVDIENDEGNNCTFSKSRFLTEIEYPDWKIKEDAKKYNL